MRTRHGHASAYTVGVYVVHDDAVLLVWHGNLHRWVPIGGRIDIETDETPHDAAVRESLEEVGVPVVLRGTSRVATTDTEIVIPVQPVLIQEIYVPTGEQFLDFVYFATAPSRDVMLDYREARGFHWFTRDDLTRFPIPCHVRDYAHAAVDELGRNANGNP